MELTAYARALLALAAVLVLGRLLGRLLRHLGQPPVIGEVLAGILLGPSLIGPEWAARILPVESAPPLRAIAMLGMVLYMFRVGLELDTGLIRQRLRATLLIAHAGIAAPLLLGVVLAFWLAPGYAGAAATPWVFALFLGVSLAVTAFPVLARILADRGLSRQPLGQMALACAAVGDVSAWCLLAAVTGMASSAHQGTAVGLIVGSLAYVAAMLLLARPLLRLALSAPTALAVPLVLAALAASAACTQWLGLHASFGAFLIGALLLREHALTQTLDRRLEGIAAWLLPAFFAYAGMRTRLDLLAGWEQWGLCLLITLVATVGKVGGTYLAARVCGEPRRPAAALGALMNARGLMELIVLQIGLDFGIISPALFSMLVVMALVTTLATTPLVRALLPRPEASPPALKPAVLANPAAR
ncbi:MAG: cation:proton antiporter [Nevskiaceae bacterium]|nr:MAG: cation:proton antiporter [Nevskiaceae bacterium]TAM33024.1 MAG: cation:proton antiporter [Nevskiaceae bacterium]